MNWFERMAMRRAGRTYARCLPAQLRSGWGAAQFYTPGQVTAALKHLRLGGRYVAIAYAGFLSEEDFASVVGSLPVAISYEEARLALGRPDRPWRGYWQGPISNAEAASRHGLPL